MNANSSNALHRFVIPLMMASAMLGLSLNTAPTAAHAAQNPAVRGDVVRRPLPPQLPRNFSGGGRYYVPSLRVAVPFTWNARNGNVRMVAGGPAYRVWFTNIIWGNNFYTYTYKWPTKIPKVPCTPIKGLSLAAFNKFFARSHFVGPEILQGQPWRYVNHWRLSGSFGPFPLTEADFYTSQTSNTTWWQLLHFGLQNLYAPDMDEWIKMQSWSYRPGIVRLPPNCHG